jgi:1-phosphatidylinositol-4-phosphate 5-kinase
MAGFSESFLMKFFGHHRMDYKGKKLYFIILNNVLYSTKKIHEIYDLKGSTAGRKTSEAEKQSSHAVLKDMDFTASKRKLNLNQAAKTALCKQLEEDCKVEL